MGSMGSEGSTGSGGGFAANTYGAMPGGQTSGFKSLKSEV